MVMHVTVLERMILLLILPNRQRHSHGQNQVILQAQKVADAYVLLFKASFYMNYETKDGGKEHYNDIIAQYNAIYAECFRTQERQHMMVMLRL